jgi:hypothetical protein
VGILSTSFAKPNKYAAKSKSSSDDKSKTKKDEGFGSVYQAMTGFLNRMSNGDGNDDRLPSSLANIPSFKAAHKLFMAERRRLQQDC